MTDTTEALLAAWDAGEPVTSIEMGGFGSDYEQCIQVTTFEIVRWMLANMPKRDWVMFDVDRDLWDRYNKWCKTDVFSLPGIKGLGHSGAQWRAAMNLAANLVRHGYAATLESAGADRHITVRRAEVYRQPPALRDLNIALNRPKAPVAAVDKARLDSMDAILLGVIADAATLRDRAVTGAAYRLNGSPHEWTDEDGEAMARYVIAASFALDMMGRRIVDNGL